MVSGGASRRRPRPVAGRGRSLRAPVAENRASRTRVVLQRISGWTGWAALTSVATTIAALGALWFTSQSILTGNQQHALAQQVAVTDRFQKAVEQLTSESVDVRLSGIYMLERLAKDSPADHSTVFEVLAAFVRTHSIASECEKWEGTENLETTSLLDLIPVDIQAVMTVIGRRDTSREAEGEFIDLSHTCLAGLDMSSADLAGVLFHGTKLMVANLVGADLAGAKFAGADLTGADFSEADLTGVNFNNAKLFGARFGTSAPVISQAWGVPVRAPAILAHADFTGADLTGADFGDVDLTTAKFESKVSLGSGTFVRAATLEGISYTDQTRWPQHFKPPERNPYGTP